jgi:LL-diaminopimelate aminotransferase
MVKRNPHFNQLKAGYLFPEVNARKKQFLAQHPHAKIISLGIGDTTEPLTPNIADALIDISKKLGTREGYVGYGAEQGIEPLRKKIAETFYGGLIAPEEIFVSDGAKCDIGRLQVLFGGDLSIAIQDPAYPVYVDGSIIQGITQIHMMPCTPENGFFPDLSKLPKVDLIYFCSPNNPTGACATRAQLEELVAFAKKNHSLILFDAAYASYIQDPDLPKSIYEIEGAKEVAIEINSFSKLAGFTGVRLGWTVVPNALKYDNGASIRADWNRITTTLFNGASILSQYGGLAVLEKKGMKEAKDLIDFYLENARLVKTTLEELGYEVFGGDNAPYLWVRFPDRKSWDVFQEILEKTHIVTTPGSGFGPAGEGFLRFTAYGKRENILEAIHRLKKFKKE